MFTCVCLAWCHDLGLAWSLPIPIGVFPNLAFHNILFGSESPKMGVLQTLFLSVNTIV